MSNSLTTSSLIRGAFKFEKVTSRVVEVVNDNNKSEKANVNNYEWAKNKYCLAGSGDETNLTCGRPVTRRDGQACYIVAAIRRYSPGLNMPLFKNY